MEAIELPKELLRVLDFDGKVEYYPTRRKFLLPFVWDYIHSKIDDTMEYSEHEINALINSWITFEDFVAIREDLFENGYIKTGDDGTKYWKVSR